MFPVRDTELHVAVLAEVTLQPGGLSVDLVQDAEHELFGRDWGREDADTLFVGDARMSTSSDESITETSVASNVGQQES